MKGGIFRRVQHMPGALAAAGLLALGLFSSGEV